MYYRLAVYLHLQLGLCVAYMYISDFCSWPLWDKTGKKQSNGCTCSYTLSKNCSPCFKLHLRFSTPCVVSLRDGRSDGRTDCPSVRLLDGVWHLWATNTPAYSILCALIWSGERYYYWSWCLIDRDAYLQASFSSNVTPFVNNLPAFWRRGRGRQPSEPHALLAICVKLTRVKVQSQRKVVNTAQQYFVSYEFLWIRRTREYACSLFRLTLTIGCYLIIVEL